MKPLALAIVAGCAIGAPPGFSPGERWTFPLVDPLADGRLVTPVWVRGHGPYLFAIDPDAHTMVDPEVVEATGAVASTLTEVRIGELAVSSLAAVTVRAHALDEGGRRIHGVLGREVIADSLVFGFDRDRGVAWLATSRAFHAPTATRVLDYDTRPAPRHGPAEREARVTATIDGVDRELRLDLGRVPNRLRDAQWSASHLVVNPAHVAIIDEAGVHHAFDRVGRAHRVIVGGLESFGVEVAPFDDDRDYDGTLGLDFVRRMAVAVDWHHRRIYTTPSAGARAARSERLARWGDLVPACEEPGCVAIRLAGTTFEVTPLRPDRDLEVIVGATTPAGELPALQVEIPAGSQPFAVPLEPAYRGAAVEVIDVSPFPRTCVASRACVVPVASKIAK